MSYTETRVGNLKKVGDFSEVTMDAYCRTEFINRFPDKFKVYTDKGLPSYIENWLDALNDELYMTDSDEQFYYNKKKQELWKTYRVKELDTENINEFIPDGAGGYRFVTQFYNGGTCLSEIINHEIERLVGDYDSETELISDKVKKFCGDNKFFHEVSKKILKFLSDNGYFYDFGTESEYKPDYVGYDVMGDYLRVYFMDGWGNGGDEEIPVEYLGDWSETVRYMEAIIEQQKKGR